MYSLKLSFCDRTDQCLSCIDLHITLHCTISSALVCMLPLCFAYDSTLLLSIQANSFNKGRQFSRSLGSYDHVLLRFFTACFVAVA